jgi:hypothetical protein
MIWLVVLSVRVQSLVKCRNRIATEVATDVTDDVDLASKRQVINRISNHIAKETMTINQQAT